MTANPTNFFEFIQAQFSILTPDEQTTIQDLIQSLENNPSKDIGSLTTRLSQFLLDHESIDTQFDEFTEGLTRPPSKITLNPQDFGSMLRNATLAPQKPTQPHQQPNDAPKPNH